MSAAVIKRAIISHGTKDKPSTKCLCLFSNNFFPQFRHPISDVEIKSTAAKHSLFWIKFSNLSKIKLHQGYPLPQPQHYHHALVKGETIINALPHRTTETHNLSQSLFSAWRYQPFPFGRYSPFAPFTSASVRSTARHFTTQAHSRHPWKKQQNSEPTTNEVISASVSNVAECSECCTCPTRLTRLFGVVRICARQSGPTCCCENIWSISCGFPWTRSVVEMVVPHNLGFPAERFRKNRQPLTVATFSAQLETRNVATHHVIAAKKHVPRLLLGSWFFWGVNIFYALLPPRFFPTARSLTASSHQQLRSSNLNANIFTSNSGCNF